MAAAARVSEKQVPVRTACGSGRLIAESNLIVSVRATVWYRGLLIRRSNPGCSGWINRPLPQAVLTAEFAITRLEQHRRRQHDVSKADHSFAHCVRHVRRLFRPGRG